MASLADNQGTSGGTAAYARADSDARSIGAQYSALVYAKSAFAGDVDANRGGVGLKSGIHSACRSISDRGKRIATFDVRTTGQKRVNQASGNRSGGRARNGATEIAQSWGITDTPARGIGGFR